MKSAIHLPLSTDSVVRVRVGDTITPKTILAEIVDTTAQEEIMVSTSLHISPSKIVSHMKKQIGESVVGGEIIAEKKGVLSSLFLKSPISGFLTGIDEEKGSVIISSGEKRSDELKIPVKGHIKKISKTDIEIDVEGTSLHVLSGSGKDTLGELHYFESGELGNKLSVDSATYVIATEAISDDDGAKCDVVDVAGCIVTESPRVFSLPWVVVDKSVFSKVKSHEGSVWMRPEELELILLI